MKFKKIFWRTVKITSIIIFNIILLIYGFCIAYKNTRLTAYGEYCEIVSFENGELKFFDYKKQMPDYFR